MAALPSQCAPLSLSCVTPIWQPLHRCTRLFLRVAPSIPPPPMGSLCVFTSRKLVGAGRSFLFPASCFQVT